ncbi:putative rab-type small G protein [Paratrimastix pyriformis]|uniref:Rab-type small G protein n=1 Tax=Paratrimastix pyriformis TaxID=342808 RepID=A0ABQ8UD67_9EUKA|nr:putative rab-type small G protein [Paratrimastix pyriformis]
MGQRFSVTPTALTVPEILVQILARVNVRSVYACSRVCRMWRDAARLPICWKLRCLTEGIVHENQKSVSSEEISWEDRYIMAKAKLRAVRMTAIGSGSAGTTSLCRRFVSGDFVPMNPFSPAKRMHKVVVLPSKLISLDLWDVNGCGKFRQLAPMYYRNSDTALLCFDCTNPSGFEELKSLMRQVQESGVSVLGVVCCKCDLAAERQVTRAEAEAFAASVGATYWETSALTGQGVQSCIEDVLTGLQAASPAEEVIQAQATRRGSNISLYTPFCNSPLIDPELLQDPDLTYPRSSECPFSICVLAQGIGQESQKGVTEETSWKDRYVLAKVDVRTVVEMIGPESAGTTSLCRRFASCDFAPTHPVSPHAVRLFRKLCILPSKLISLELWDIGGKSRHLAPIYYRKSVATLLCFDCTNPAGFEEIRSLLPRAQGVIEVFTVGVLASGLTTVIGRSALHRSLQGDEEDLTPDGNTKRQGLYNQKILVQIIARVNIRSLYACSRVCRIWRDAARLPICWKLRCLSEGIVKENQQGDVLEGTSWEDRYIRTKAKVRTSVKMTAIGPENAGTTSLCWRFASGDFVPSVSPAIYLRKLCVLPSALISLDLWDISGKYRQLASIYFRGSVVILFCFDCTNPTGFEALKSLVSQSRSTIDTLVLGVVCCKCDLVNERKVPRAEAEAFATSVGASYWETSALTGQGVRNCFEGLVREAADRRLLPDLTPPRPEANHDPIETR